MARQRQSQGGGIFFIEQRTDKTLLELMYSANSPKETKESHTTFSISSPGSITQPSKPLRPSLAMDRDYVVCGISGIVFTHPPPLP